MGSIMQVVLTQCMCCTAFVAGIPGGQGDLELVEVGVRCSLEQMLEEGFYHSDPHPGNLLHTQTGELAYIDFGEQRLPPSMSVLVISCKPSGRYKGVRWCSFMAQA